MTGSKPVPAQLLQHPAHERQLEQDEVALEVGEARAGPSARPPPCRSVRAGELEVVAARRAARAPLAQRRCPRRRRTGRAGSAATRQRVGAPPSASAPPLGLELLDARAHPLHLGDRLATRPRRCCLASPIAFDAVVAGAACSALQLRHAGRAARASQLERARRASLVGAVATARQRGPRRVGIAGDRRAGRARRYPVAGLSGPASPPGALCSELLRQELGHLLGLLAGDDVRRHRARRRTRRCGSRTATQFTALGALVEVRPVLVLTRPHVGRGALGARPR